MTMVSYESCYIQSSAAWPMTPSSESDSSSSALAFGPASPALLSSLAAFCFIYNERARSRLSHFA